MEEHLKIGFVEQIYQGYESEVKEVSNKYGITHKSKNLNLAKIKRESNLKAWIDNQSSERFIYLDKRSFLFIDKQDKILNAYMSEDNKKQLIRKFQKEKELTYLTAIIILRNTSIEEEHDKLGQLFDASIYEVEKYDTETYDEAVEKSKNILDDYGDYIKSVRIITRDSSSGDTPRISMYELSDGCELLYKEDWSKYNPVNFSSNRDSETMSDKKKESPKKSKPKHAKLKKKKRKIE